MTTTDKKHWNPSEGFPIDIPSASDDELVGALLAVFEHQQEFAMMSRRENGNVSTTYHQSAIACPAIYLGIIAERSRHHEDKILRRNRGVQHADLIDEIVSRLPDSLPTFVPRARRWVSERTYRSVRRHMRETYNDYCFNRDQETDDEPEETDGVEEAANA